jgi:hypothetical protein
MLTGMFAAPARAQQLRPLPPVVFDVRGFSTKLAQDATTAMDLGGVPGVLPSRALGVAFGAHVYPLKSKGLVLGVGVEIMSGDGKSRLVDDAGNPIATIEERVQGVAGVVSINFGHHEGWSYLSAGAGPLRFNTFAGDPPAHAPPGKTTLNVGGGARWFTTPHIAFAFDVRIYLAKAIASTLTTPGRGAKRLLLISVGVGIK